MENINIAEMAGALDELSLRTQLLHSRPQREKPLLKYSSSEPGPIYLYQNPEISQHMTSTAISSAPNSPAKSAVNGQAKTSAPYGASPYSYVPSPDPYARPLSAKGLMTAGLERSKTMTQTIASSLHATNMTNNSLFRPTKQDGKPFNKPTESEAHNRLGVEVPVTATTKVVSIQSSSTTMTHSAKMKFEESLVKPLTPERGARPPSALRRPSSSTVRNPYYSPAKPYTEISPEDEMKFPSETKKPENLNNTISRAITTLHKAKTARVRNPENSSLGLEVLSRSAGLYKSSPRLGSARATPDRIQNENRRPTHSASTASSASASTAKPSSAKSDDNSKAARPSVTAEVTTSKTENVVITPDFDTVKRSDIKTPVSLTHNDTMPSPGELDTKPYSNGLQGSTANSPSLTRSSSAPNSVKSQSPASQVSPSPITPYYLKSSKPGKRIANEQRRISGEENKSQSSKESSQDEDEEEGEEDSPAPSTSDRTAGEGETLDGEDDFDDEDMIDGLEDDELEGQDDDDESSTGSTAGSSLRIRSASLGRCHRALDSSALIRMKSARRRTHSSYQDNSTQPALIKSLFPHTPPYINFAGEGERIEQLPWELRKLLKWRMCAITPNVVKNVINRSGFRTTKKHYDWLGCWGRHMKAQGFKSIREYQKLNHFPGSFQIGRKDRLWRNLSKLQAMFGRKEFSFFPTTFVLPFDMKLLKRAWDEAGPKQKWIIKPPASARGIGIKVINKWNAIPKKRPVIVQKYLGRPLLINGSKFDCRIYVYVTSYDPLRIYVYEDGLVRFCSAKYSNSMKHINNKYMHLTNYSIQKKNNEYESNSDDTVCQGHKWSLKSLWGYLLKKGVNTNEIWKSIKDLIVKTIISAESSINSYIKMNVRNRYSVHELFGFDVMLDDTYKPWVLEVNISPSLHSNSQLDLNIKGAMVKDLHNLAGFRIPDKIDVTPSPGSDSYKMGPPSNKYCTDKRLSLQSLSADEKVKHAYYSQRHQDEAVLSSITDILTPDDLRMLIESIDEDSRKGGFQRVFPTPSTHKYLRYFDAPRYYNLFLDTWCQKFNRIEAKGIGLIESACRQRIHLQNPTDDPRHQWCPPSSRLASGSSTLISTSSLNLAKMKKKGPEQRLPSNSRSPMAVPIPTTKPVSVSAS